MLSIGKNANISSIMRHYNTEIWAFKMSFQSSADTGRNIYSYYSIPYGQSTGGERRFAPPEFADPVNDGSDVFDATYLTYLWNALGRVCPQVTSFISLGVLCNLR